jgi:hypothetical protein
VQGPVLRAWIDAGAAWPETEADRLAREQDRDPRLDHWAWQPVVRPAVPPAHDVPPANGGPPAQNAWPARNAIDRFLQATLAAKGLAPAPEADRRTLIRRLSFDLLGLPPTPEEVAAFVADDSPDAYDKLLERLLASPHYGERWARHWLDIAHYADTHGFDWMLMAAQGFQESRLDQQARSPVGAIGIMQLMAPTAAEIGFADIGEEETNVAAGIAYMARIRDRYFNEPEIEPSQRILFAIAAYNAGPNRIQRLRVRARAQGLDPNLWFGNVERIVQQSVGDETVTYVANIYRFFHAYATFTDPLLGQR